MDEHRRPRPALHQRLEGVHPRVVGAETPPSDEHHRGRRAVEPGAQALHVGGQWLGRELDLPGRRAQNLQNAWLERTEIDPVRARFEPGETDPVRARAEGVAVWT